MPKLCYIQSAVLLFKQILGFFLLLPVLFTGQLTEAQIPQLKFSHITSLQGLSNSTIETIYQDSRGFMWFGTRDGLNKYDGYQITVFKNKSGDTTSITDSYIRCIYEDAKHQLWIGTKNGLNRFNKDKNNFIQYKHNSNKQALSNNAVNALYKDRKGNFWIGTADGCLNQYNYVSNTFNHYYYKKAHADDQINYIYEDKKSTLWLGTSHGIKIFDRSSKTFNNLFTLGDKGLFELLDPVNSIQEDKAGNLWLGTDNNGLAVLDFNNKTVTRYMPDMQAGSLGNAQVKCLLTDHTGNIWTGSINGGLDLFLPATASFKNFQNESENPGSLSQRTVSAIFEDNQHNLWVGTHRGGINLYTPQANKFRLFQNHADNNSLSYNDVRAFSEDADHKIWIGTDGGGLNVFDPAKNRFSYYRCNPADNNSLGSDAVLDILMDGNQAWISTWGGGLNKLEKSSGRFKRYKHNASDVSSISSNYVQKSFKDSEGGFWVATYYGGLNLFDPKSGKFSRFSIAPDQKSRIKGNNIVSISEDKSKNLWFGTDDGGLNRYNLVTKRFTHYFDREEKLPDLRVIFTDHAGRVWLGQSGLYRYNPEQDKFKIFTKENQLGNNFISGIAEDDASNLWISTTNGLIKFNPVSLNYKRYNTADGLQGQEFEVNAVLKTSKGELYFGGVNGFNKFNPTAIESNRFIPPVVITSLQIFNKNVYPDSAGSPLSKDISVTRSIKLDHQQSTLAFSFAALNYTATENNKYAYRMEGLDTTWYYTNERKVSFTNLNPGNYVFHIKAANNDGLWNPKSTDLTVYIAPPVWATWWFRSIVIILLIWGAYLLLQFKHRLDKRRIEEQKREDMHQLKLQFFTNISHEFRTPLSLILGPLEILLQQGQSASRNYYEVMNRNAHRLLSLINELMDFRKVETGALKLSVKHSNITSFFEELTDEFKDAAFKKNIELKVNFNIADPEAWFDRQVVEKIVLNLINNSLKYTPVNGCITIEALDSLENFRSEFENELVFKNDYRGSKYLYIRIADNGIGISKESIEHLFERYYRITESHLGSGIGLAFVKSLTLLHKGNIYVHSQRQKGTDIIIGLPVGEVDYTLTEKCPDRPIEGGVRLESIIVESQIEIIDPGTTEPSKPAKTQYLILIVDDNEEIRTFVKDCLKDTYKIAEAADGYSGILKAKDESPDLIVSDVMMPGMNGLDFCRSIKEDIETSHIPFIMLTAKTNFEAELEGVGSGADLYLSKPLSVSLLTLSIRNIFEQRQKIKQRYLKNHQIEAHELVHSSKDKDFMDKLLKVINADISNPDLDIDQLCSAVAMSRTKLYHKIKELSGQAPNEFIRSIRLKKAVEILTHEDVLLTEVMFRVGIQTQSYFTKAFKKEFGKTPTQYIQDLMVKPTK